MPFQSEETGLYGWLSSSGEVVREPELDSIGYLDSEGWFPVRREDGSCAYLDMNGAVMLELADGKALTWTQDFQDGYAIVKVEGCEG